MANNALPFSQRVGGVAVPPQLQTGVVSDELRRLLWAAVYSDMLLCRSPGYEGAWYENRWLSVLRDIHLRIFKKMPDTFSAHAHDNEQALKGIFERGGLNYLFDFVEYLLAQDNVGSAAKREIVTAFEESRSAYRVFDGLICPVSSEQEGEVFASALQACEQSGALGARRHILASAQMLRAGDWAGSVRESIHAVESVAVQLAPTASTLGAALSVLEKGGHLHGAMKIGFCALYGYASDEKGVRHALALQDAANVDEADAIYMLGSCASFISYLISKGRSANLIT